jgi:ribose 5-phosphate isomerase B
MTPCTSMNDIRRANHLQEVPLGVTTEKGESNMANERYVIAIGADNAGADMKNALKQQLEADPRVDVIDLGVPDASDNRAYPHVGIDVAQAVARGDARRGLLVCGTGIGMAISANKVPGVRATVAHDSYSVERSVLSNDCQVLTLGARVIGLELAKRLVDEWLDYEFDPSSPSAAKVAVIAEFEERGSGEGDDASS